jgi:hypothetical protein
MPAPPPVAAATPAPPATPLASGRYLGCFKDQGAATATQGRDLNGALFNDARMTPAACVKACRDKNFAYAGVQYSSYCFCGNSYGSSGPADNCNMRCSGNAGEACGGAWANSVYATGAAPAASAAKPAPPVAAAKPAPQAPQRQGSIQVVAGTYGGNCPREKFGDKIARGNVTAALAAACNGKDVCDYRVDYTKIGDPAYGCRKTYVAEWRCVPTPTVHRAEIGGAAAEAGLGMQVRLQCASASTGSAQPVPQPTARSAASSSSPSAVMAAVEHNVNRPGSDYRSFDLATPDPGICAAACAKEAQCRAWTFVKPGVQAATARCWLKNRAPAALADSRTVSGVKAGAR